ncbi:hypothetical protein PCE1_001938 [Barthelona sp. PCE]
MTVEPSESVALLGHLIADLRDCDESEANDIEESIIEVMEYLEDVNDGILIISTLLRDFPVQSTLYRRYSVRLIGFLVGMFETDLEPLLRTIIVELSSVFDDKDIQVQEYVVRTFRILIKFAITDEKRSYFEHIYYIFFNTLTTIVSKHVLPRVQSLGCRCFNSVAIEALPTYKNVDYDLVNKYFCSICRMICEGDLIVNESLLILQRIIEIGGSKLSSHAIDHFCNIVETKGDESFLNAVLEAVYIFCVVFIADQMGVLTNFSTDHRDRIETVLNMSENPLAESISELLPKIRTSEPAPIVKKVVHIPSKKDKKRSFVEPDEKTPLKKEEKKAPHTFLKRTPSSVKSAKRKKRKNRTPKVNVNDRFENTTFQKFYGGFPEEEKKANVVDDIPVFIFAKPPPASVERSIEKEREDIEREEVKRLETEREDMRTPDKLSESVMSEKEDEPFEDELVVMPPQPTKEEKREITKTVESSQESSIASSLPVIQNDPHYVNTPANSFYNKLQQRDDSRVQQPTATVLTTPSTTTPIQSMYTPSGGQIEVSKNPFQNDLDFATQYTVSPHRVSPYHMNTEALPQRVQQQVNSLIALEKQAIENYHAKLEQQQVENLVDEYRQYFKIFKFSKKQSCKIFVKH